MSGKAASPLSPVIARLRAAGARVGHLPEHNPTSTMRPLLAYSVTEPNGDRYTISGPGHDYRMVLARLETIAARLEAGTTQGTTSSSPGRSYLTGMPVSINVHDDGTVTLTVHAEDIVECVADADIDDWTREREAEAVADSITAGAALSATGTTSFEIHLTPKGA